MDTLESPDLTADRPRSRRFTHDLAVELFADWQASGLSLAAFARAQGLDVKRLYSWRQRLRHAQSGSMGLAEVTVVSERRFSGVVVVLPNGIRIEIPADWNASAIAALCGGLSC